MSLFSVRDSVLEERLNYEIQILFPGARWTTDARHDMWDTLFFKLHWQGKTRECTVDRVSAYESIIGFLCKLAREINSETDFNVGEEMPGIGDS